MQTLADRQTQNYNRFSQEISDLGLLTRITYNTIFDLISDAELTGEQFLNLKDNLNSKPWVTPEYQS